MSRLAPLRPLFAVAAIAMLPLAAQAQHHGPTLHLTTRWKECSFQIDPALTQRAWRQFTREAAMVTYFRPLADARPMGVGNWEVSLLQFEVGIDDHDAAWNDTFVHPDSAHWLFEGSGLKFPGLAVRTGVTDRVDVGAYFTKNPAANYGFVGGQVQVSLDRDPLDAWAASARVSGVTLFGPEDLTFAVLGADLVASRRFATRWAAFSPYAGVSGHLSTSHERTTAVALHDETVVGTSAMLGLVTEVSVARVGLEYNAAAVRSVSLKMGFAF